MKQERSASDSHMPLSEESQRTIQRRLRRLEGQVRGVQRMVEAQRDCREIIHQVAAIKAAAHSLGTVVLEHFIIACLFDQPAFLSQEDARAIVQEALREMAH